MKAMLTPTARRRTARRTIARGTGLLVAIGVFVASAVPAIGSDSGTITGTVTAAAPCITIGTDTVDFGTLPFSTDPYGSPPGRIESRTLRDVSSYTNCSGAGASVYHRGTDAQSTTSSTKWTLGDGGGGANTCFEPNVYKLAIWPQDGNAGFVVDKTNRLLETAPAGATRGLGVTLHMPCTGSSGAGENLAFQYILTATL